MFFIVINSQTPPPAVCPLPSSPRPRTLRSPAASVLSPAAGKGVSVRNSGPSAYRLQPSACFLSPSVLCSPSSDLNSPLFRLLFVVINSLLRPPAPSPHKLPHVRTLEPQDFPSRPGPPFPHRLCGLRSGDRRRRPRPPALSACAKRASPPPSERRHPRFTLTRASIQWTREPALPLLFVVIKSLLR